MRKRIKKRLVCRSTSSYVIKLEEPPVKKHPFIKFFGDWVQIKESDIPIYTKMFKIEWR